MREAFEIRSRLLPAGNRLTGISEAALGECLTVQKRYAEAEPLLVESHRILKTTAGEMDPRTMETARRLAALYESWGKVR